MTPIKENSNQSDLKTRILGTKNILKPILQRCVFIDIQGFIINNKFIPKELSVTSSYTGEDIQTILFESPCSFNDLSTTDKKTAKWLENNHHGIKFTSGHIKLEKLPDLMKMYLTAHVIFVKGYKKCEYLNEVFKNVEIVNLENKNDVDVKKFEKCYHNCCNHFVNYSFCSCSNVKMLRQFK